MCTRMGAQGWWSNNQMTSLMRQTLLIDSKQPVPDVQETDQARAYLAFPQLKIAIVLAFFSPSVLAMEVAQLKCSPTCAGDPVTWNLPAKTLYWGKRTAQLFPSVQPHPTMQDPLHVLYQFLHSRLDFQSEPISCKFGYPLACANN